jgi:NTE family protein
MPIALAKEMGADIVIAVDVNAVDYEVDAESVNSITSLLNQLIVVLTKNTITNQTQLADLIIEPPLFGQTVLDFHKASEILQVGEAAVESYQEQLKTIAAVFEQLDALDVKDPNRQGTYFALDDVYIATVSHKALDVNITEFDLKPFNSFIGYPFNDLQKETITAMFDKIRERERYATLTFAYTDAIQSVDGKIWGNLEVQTRAFEKRRSEVAAGVYGSTSLIFAKGNQAKLDFIGDLKVRYSLYSVVDWSVEVANEDAFSVFTAVSKRFAKKWVGGVEVGYVSGGIHPTNLRSSFRGVAFRDRAFISCISIKWDNQDTTLIKLKSNLDYVSFGNPDLTINKKGFIPSFSIEALYSTLTYGFFPQEGLRGDFLASGELTKQFDYRLAAQFLIAIPISNNDTISFKVNGSSATATLQRSSSYYDYGGVRGIATYSTTTLVDQMVLLGFDYTISSRKSP